ncbi:hypothetical protein V1511DRAFT_493291 [Dipodascopsis uninucleata]
MSSNGKKPLYGDAPPKEHGRKTWDEEEMIKSAHERFEKEKLARAERFDRPPTPPDAREVEIRSQRLNLDADLNKVTLVPAGASAVGKKGRGAGYYCEACDLTYKDSLQWIDHLNSKQHLRATGQTETQKKATLEEVRARLDWLRRKRDELTDAQGYDIHKRIAERKKIEDEERRKRKERKLELRRKKRQGSIADDKVEDEDSKSIMDMMGISGFGTTKA